MTSREEIRAVLISSAEYPKLLKKIQQPPHPLWVRGAGIDNSLFHLASVGSRKVSPEVIQHLQTFLEQVCIAYSDVAGSSLVIVSGLAEGVDGASHAVGLAQAHTIGVLPTAINRMSPAENLPLAEQMLQEHQRGTAIVSEHAPILDDLKSPWTPLARNRITNGMSHALLVSGVSRLRSGSMSTVEYARKEKRPIYFLKGTVSQVVQNMLQGVYHAVEVSDPKQFVEAHLLEQK